MVVAVILGRLIHADELNFFTGIYFSLYNGLRILQLNVFSCHVLTKVASGTNM